jgi:uncharacterized protein involved in cysteine biosynthesis
MKSDNKSIAGLVQQVQPWINIAKKHLVILFIILLAIIYGYVLSKINNYNNVEPSAGAVAAQVKTLSTPRINPNLVSQLQSLNNNSVNVQALFSQSRQNPF